MTIDDISDRFKNDLEQAVSAWSIDKNPQFLLDLIEQLQKESYLEGIDGAKQLLNDFLIESNSNGHIPIPSAS